MFISEELYIGLVLCCRNYAKTIALVKDNLKHQGHLNVVFFRYSVIMQFGK